MLEIERTYLVNKLPLDVESYKMVEIRQGYFSESPFELTKKFTNGG